MKRFVAALALASATLVLPACAVSGLPALQSSGAGVPAGASIILAEPREGHSFEEVLAAALADALRAEAFTVSDEGAYFLQYGVASRSSSISLIRAGDDNRVETVSAHRKKLLLDGCAANRLRITVNVIDRATGVVVNNTSVDVDDCNFDATDAAAFARQLAASLAAK